MEGRVCGVLSHAMLVIDTARTDAQQHVPFYMLTFLPTVQISAFASQEAGVSPAEEVLTCLQGEKVEVLSAAKAVFF